MHSVDSENEVLICILFTFYTMLHQLKTCHIYIGLIRRKRYENASVDVKLLLRFQ